jgi:dolichyl-phosphate-mannose--protein O-mannosyl transferase
MKRWGYFLALILIINFLLRLFRLDYPKNYIFDEVYHVPTFRAFSQNNPAAFDVYAKSPEPNTAYDWLHPPLAKLIQAGSIKLLGDNSFAWRFPSALFGTISAGAAYFLAVTVTRKRRVGWLAALLFSLDGLQLTMSRIAMNDIFVTTFILFSLAFVYKKDWPKAAIFTGLALSTKHSAVLLFPVFALWLIYKRPKDWLKAAAGLIIVPPLIYLLSFSQFWLQGHSWRQFVDLHKQIYWYQTNLKETHGYQSAAWQWPILTRPVWFHVEYLDGKIANIYNLGNPLVFLLGLIALVNYKNKYLRLAYFGLFAPFIASPRIMFLHHYLPSLSVLTIILAGWLDRFSKKTIMLAIVAVALVFIFFYPINTGIALPKEMLKYWFWLPSWR